MLLQIKIEINKELVPTLNRQHSVTEMSYDRKLKIWSGPIEANRFGPKDSVGSVLLQYLLETPDHMAQVKG